LGVLEGEAREGRVLTRALNLELEDTLGYVRAALWLRRAYGVSTGRMPRGQATALLKEVLVRE
jgi:hypothetical protein